MRRLACLAAILASAILASVALAAQAADAPPRADAARMKARIDALAEFGANDDGGIDRVAYSDADRAARAWVMDEMRALGLQNVRIDAGGNILGRRPGTDRAAKPIMFGSHVDSVPGGGNFDGQAGVVAALEAIELLNAGDIETRSPLDVVVFSNEEGGLVGSLAMTGRLEPGALDVVSDAGVTIREGIKSVGGDPTRLAEARIPKGALKAFFELHIEQGAVLDEADEDVGVVEGIVGIEWWDVTLTGVANHAGTTPMNRRTDAMVAAAWLTLAINDIAVKTPGRQVATVGRIEALPGAPNVIPGEVRMSLEIRDLETAKIESVFARVEEAATAVTARTGVAIAFERLDVASHPAITDPALRQVVADAAEDLGLAYRLMPSGAGHDAQDMALIAPTAMIFTPSVGGVSHSPKEFTFAEDLANGADVLTRSILAADAMD